MAPSPLKYKYSVLFAIKTSPVPPTAPGDAAGVLLGQVFLQEALCHLHSMRPS